MTPKGAQTRAHLLDTALGLFRAQGYDATSMRDIAAAAGLSLGAAYHYFDSKEALVSAWYDRVQERHEAATAELLPGIKGTGPRLRAILSAKLDLVLPEKRLLGALFRYAADPEHPLGTFSPGSAPVRDRAVATFAAALDGAGLAPDQAALLGRGLWLAHLGLLLYALHDRSEGAARTRGLAELLADLADKAVGLLYGPMGGAVLGGLLARLGALKEIPDAAPETPVQSGS